MLTYFNFAMSLEFWSQFGLKYLLVHKGKITLKINLRKGSYLLKRTRTESNCEM